MTSINTLYHSIHITENLNLFFCGICIHICDCDHIRLHILMKRKIWEEIQRIADESRLTSPRASKVLACDRIKKQAQQLAEVTDSDTSTHTHLPVPAHSTSSTDSPTSSTPVSALKPAIVSTSSTPVSTSILTTSARSKGIRNKTGHITQMDVIKHLAKEIIQSTLTYEDSVRFLNQRFSHLSSNALKQTHARLRYILRLSNYYVPGYSRSTIIWKKKGDISKRPKKIINKPLEIRTFDTTRYTSLSPSNPANSPSNSAAYTDDSIVVDVQAPNPYPTLHMVSDEFLGISSSPEREDNLEPPELAPIKKVIDPRDVMKPEAFHPLAPTMCYSHDITSVIYYPIQYTLPYYSYESLPPIFPELLA